jgi:transcriptional regulator with XRE-family HTH domain
MKNKKTETFVYEGLGFPIELIDAPMKKVFGEWVMDIDMNQFQLFIFNGLIHKPSRITGKELKFMRKFLGLTTAELGKKLGITHVAILKWEKETTKMSVSQEIYLRMLFSALLNKEELKAIFDEIKPEKLVESDNEQSQLSVDIKGMRLVA